MTIYDLIGFSKEEVASIANNIENYYLSFSIKKSNSEKLDELVKKFNAKSRSVIIDMLIEKSEL